MIDIKIIVGRNIRALRKEIGWTIEKLAENADVSASFLTMVELGKKNPSLEVMAKIADALGVRCERLFQESEPSNTVPHSLRILEKDLVETLSIAIHTRFDKLAKHTL